MEKSVMSVRITTLCVSLQSIKDKVKAEEEKDEDEDLSQSYTNDLKQLLEMLSEHEQDSMLGREHQPVIAHTVIVAAGHCGKHYWTNITSRKTANNLLSKILELTSNETVQQLLVGGDNSEKSGALGTMLPLLRDNLTKDKWKEHPVHKQALVWCIKQLKHPSVSPYLDTFLPATLMILDDHSDYHRILALGAASHIIRNVDPTELRWYNRADVLYQAMKPLLYGSSPEVTMTLHACLLHLLPVLDAYPKDIPVKPNKAAEVFQLLLNSLQTESKLAARKVYASYLSRYIELLGIFCVRHMKLLLPVLTSTIEGSGYTGTEETRRYALQALATLITHAWPRIPPHKDTILKCLVRVVSDLCPSSTNVPKDKGTQSQLCQVSQCFKVLQAACPDVEEYYRTLMSGCQHVGLIFCLKQSFT